MAIRRKDIVEYILKLLGQIDDVDDEIYKFVDAIAVDVLGGKKALQRGTDPPKLVGMILNATWKNGKEQGRKVILDALTEAIENNENLQDKEVDE